MSFSDWLKARQTPAKRVVARWAELSEALEAFWEEQFDPAVQRMIDAQSVYTADPDDLVTIMGEFGDSFRADIGSDSDRPHQVAWRRWELQQKESVAAVVSALRRKLRGFIIEWNALYASKGSAYGETFFTLPELKSMGGWADYWLTSRGRVDISTDDLARYWGGGDFCTFIAAIEGELARVIPTHICYEVAFFIASYGLFCRYATTMVGGETIMTRPRVNEQTVSNGHLRYLVAMQSAEILSVKGTGGCLISGRIVLDGA